MADRSGVPIGIRHQIRDEDGEIAAAIRQAEARGADIITTAGGVSIGARDRMPAVLHALGATIHLHGIKMRAGKLLL